MIALAKCKTKRDFPGRMMEALDLYSPEIDADPFPYYEILREQYPCYWSDSGNLWILSRYDDIVQATRDWETFSSSQGNMIDELPGRAGPTLGTAAPPPPRSATGVEPSRVRAQERRAAHCTHSRYCRPRARAHMREKRVRVHQRFLQPNHGRRALPHHGPASARPCRH